jgi:hypothetical protein
MHLLLNSVKKVLDSWRRSLPQRALKCIAERVNPHVCAISVRRETFVVHVKIEAANGGIGSRPTIWDKAGTRNGDLLAGKAD